VTEGWGGTDLLDERTSHARGSASNAQKRRARGAVAAPLTSEKKGRDEVRLREMVLEGMGKSAMESGGGASNALPWPGKSATKIPMDGKSCGTTWEGTRSLMSGLWDTDKSNGNCPAAGQGVRLLELREEK